MTILRYLQHIMLQLNRLVNYHMNNGHNMARKQMLKYYKCVLLLFSKSMYSVMHLYQISEMYKC